MNLSPDYLIERKRNKTQLAKWKIFSLLLIIALVVFVGKNYSSDLNIASTSLQGAEVVGRIKINDIIYIEGMKDYSRIYTQDQKIMTLQNLKKIEEALPTPPFMRIHKSYIISLPKIDSIGKNDITIGEQTIPIGGLYKKSFLAFIEQQQLLG